MKIQTQQFGELEFGPELIINFPNGIYGFEELNSYLLIKTEDDLFYWLNSIDEPEIAFPVVGIRILDENYPMIDGYEPFGIVNLNADPLKITINLKAPVYIDQDDKSGFQKIIDVDKYPVEYNLFTD